MSQEKMSLYYFPSCPFCVKVLDVITELGLNEIELRHIHEQPQHAEDLRAATGRTTVPCLRTEGPTGDRWLHESDDIVDFLRNLP